MHLLIPPPLIGLICAAAIWALSAYAPGFNVTFPGQRLLAFVVMGAGLVMDGISIAAFFKAKTTVSPLSPQKTSQIVETGLYRISRNPMYLGLLLILAGYSVLRGSPLALPVLAGFVAYITAFQILPEEERLLNAFGEPYAAYKRRVRRWI